MSVVTIILFGAGIVFAFIMLYVANKKKTKTIAEELNFYKQEKEYASEAMMVLSKEFDIIYANQAAKELFVITGDKGSLRATKEIELKADGSDPVGFFQALKIKCEVEKDNFHLHNALLVDSGKMKQVNIYVDKNRWNIEGTITCIVDMHSISSVAESHLPKDGSIDFFTGIPSQFSAMSDINSFVMKSQKSSESFALFLVGIDNFMELQATLGQAYINQLIKSLALFLTNRLDEKFKVYKMDCDKFLLILENAGEDNFIRHEARDMITDIIRYYKNNDKMRITTSVGIAKYPRHGGNAAKLIDHVYIALTQAQKESNSNIEFLTSDYQTLHKDEVKMNEEISKGLKNHEFFLYYQPAFDLETEEMIGVEALMRWDHPEHGIISADKFLDIAEKTGLIVDIGEYAFKEAISQRKKWDDEELRDVKITLNLSLKEMQVDMFVPRLQILFHEYSIEPGRFNLDISEESAMHNIEKTIMDFKIFKELGVSLSIDNFGASKSSIKHLQELPLDMIKLDRSLVFDIYNNMDHQIIVKAMIKMIHSFGFKASAEGIETSKESSLMYDLDCDYAQGYLFSKPLSAYEFAELIR